MSKNKTLAIVLGVLFALVLVVALGQSVFRVGKVELVAHTTTNYLSSLSESTVLSSSQLTKGKSVFLLDKNTYKNNLEKSQPYIKVLSIEVAWPNTVKFHYSERTELYAILLSDGAYAFVDDDFKVLRVSKTAYTSTQQNCITIDCGFAKSSSQIETGEFLDKNDFFDYTNLKQAYIDLNYTESQMKSMISSISVEETEKGHTIVMQTFLGVKIQILNSGYYTSKKVALSYAMLETLDSTEYSSGTIFVFKNDQSVLESMYFA